MLQALALHMPYDLIVDTAKGYRLDDRDSSPEGARVFSFVQRTDQLWDPLNLLSCGYGG
jgi:hypothetical protein